VAVWIFNFGRWSGWLLWLLFWVCFCTTSSSPTNKSERMWQMLDVQQYAVHDFKLNGDAGDENPFAVEVKRMLIGICLPCTMWRFAMRARCLNLTAWQIL